MTKYNFTWTFEKVRTRFVPVTISEYRENPVHDMIRVHVPDLAYCVVRWNGSNIPRALAVYKHEADGSLSTIQYIHSNSGFVCLGAEGKKAGPGGCRSYIRILVHGFQT